MTVQVELMPTSVPSRDGVLDYQTRPTLMPARLALPVVPSAHVRPVNAFYRYRPALAFSIAGRSARMTSSPPTPHDVSRNRRLSITVDEVAGAVTLSNRLIEAVIAELDPNLRLDHLEPPHAALVLELVLNDALSVLEAGLGCRLAIISVGAADHEIPKGAVALAFSLAVDGYGTSYAELLLQPGHATMLAQFLDRAAPPTDAPSLMRAGGAIQLPFAVCVRIATTTCSVREIATLSQGDVVMADHWCRQMRVALVVIAEHLVAPVELTAAGAQILARPTRSRDSLWEWGMENGADTPRADLLQKVDLDDIPVKLLFELGRLELSLAQIRQLVPGALLALQRPLEDSVDILANGRRIGRGNLIQIGDSLGIRVTRLFDNV